MAVGVRWKAREGHAEEAAEAEIWIPGCGTAKRNLCHRDTSERYLKKNCESSLV